MRLLESNLLLCGLLMMSVSATAGGEAPVKSPGRYLFPSDYMADPSAHVFDGKIYIYPSHDWDSPVNDAADGNHFDMKDYHVFSIDGDFLTGNVVDHGVIFSVDDVPWASRQLWAADAACKDGKYYHYFTARDKEGVFRIGVAVADSPVGPFKVHPLPIAGTYSIDPAVYEENGEYFIYFGGLGGGQLQKYRDNVYDADADLPAKNEPSLPPRVARLADDMVTLAEDPKPVMILDAAGNPLAEGDKHRFYEASWLHKYIGKYYFSYSTGNSHTLSYAIGDSPYGPFTYSGEILTPVVGWTTHHSVLEHDGKWWLVCHDSQPSGGLSRLRSMKVFPLSYRADGTIVTIDGGK